MIMHCQQFTFDEKTLVSICTSSDISVKQSLAFIEIHFELGSHILKGFHNFVANHSKIYLFLSVSYGGQGGAFQKSGGIFLSCLQTTLTKHGPFLIHL